jgi:hypothetical protein
MLYEHRSFSLGYVRCALPKIALIAGHIKVAADDVMVYDILEQIKLGVCPVMVDMLPRTVASSKKNSLAGRFSK